MDLSDLARAPTQPEPLPASHPLDPHQLVAQMGSEVASTLSSALERVNALAATGRIDRPSLSALRDEIALARRIGIMGQQLSRFASGQVQIARERVNLTQLLRDALVQRGREIDARGIEVRQVLGPAEVAGDPTLLFSLLQAVIDWSFEHTVSRIDFTLDTLNWPVCARLTCQFAHQPPDEVVAARGPNDDERIDALETMSWRLLHQAASVLALRVQRRDTLGRTALAIEFPDTLAPHVAGLESIGVDEGGLARPDGERLAGRHVLVVAPRRELRSVVREALRPMGLMVDFVTSTEEAAAFCRNALPHAVIHEAALAGERFDGWRRDVLAQVPDMAFVEIAEDGIGFETCHVGNRRYGRVARDAVLTSLATALTHELTRLGSVAG